MTLTATPDTAVNPAETQPDAGRRGRVWKAPGIPEAKERPPRGATAIALLTAGALTLGGAVVANLDDGPPAPERAVASMFEVTDEIGAQSLWTQGITGAGVNVAVIDTGIAPVPELSDQIVAAVDLSGEVVDPSVEPGDAFGHGTHMAGIIAGRQPGSDPAQAAARPDDFFGVAPDAGLVSVKVAQADGSVTGGSLVAGIDWVVAHADEHEISVLTLAFDAGDIDSYRTDPVAAALERAWAAGIVVVTAAGNQGSSSSGLASTARDPYVIAVAGTDSTSATVVPDWASAGDGVRDPDLAAPGAHIASLRAPGSNADVTHPEGRVGDREFLASGSSPAAAVVTGVAALLLDARPDLRPDQVKHLLVESAVDLDAPAKFVGNGLVDASAAVTGIATHGQPELGAVDRHSRTDRLRRELRPGVVVVGLQLVGLQLVGVVVVGVELVGVVVVGVVVVGLQLVGLQLVGVVVVGLQLVGVVVVGVVVVGLQLVGLQLVGVELVGVVVVGLQLVGLQLVGLQLVGVELVGVVVVGLQLVGVVVVGVELLGVNPGGRLPASARLAAHRTRSPASEARCSGDRRG